MLQHQWKPGFPELLHGALIVGETISHASECFGIRSVIKQDHMEMRPGTIGDSTKNDLVDQWKGIALTDLNLRILGWGSANPVGVKGWVQRVAVGTIATTPIPQVRSALCIPLGSINTAQTTIMGAEALGYSLLWRMALGERLEQMCRLNVVAMGMNYEFFSPYSNFVALADALSATLAGRSRITGGVAAPTAAPAAPSPVVILAELLSDGVLTDEEFVAARTGACGSDLHVAERVGLQLRQLRSLQETGVLSADEFEIKKKSILDAT